jgi:hypothetical protein
MIVGGRGFLCFVVAVMMGQYPSDLTGWEGRFVQHAEDTFTHLRPFRLSIWCSFSCCRFDLTYLL